MPVHSKSREMMTNSRGYRNPLNTEQLRLLSCSAIHFCCRAETHSDRHCYRHWMMHSKQDRAVTVMTNQRKLERALAAQKWSHFLLRMSFQQSKRVIQQSKICHITETEPILSKCRINVAQGEQSKCHEEATQKVKVKAALPLCQMPKIPVLGKSEKHKAG